MARQDPLEGILKQPFSRAAQSRLLPDIDSGQTQAVDLPVPRHVIAGEEIPVPMQQRHAAVGVPGDRNDPEIRRRLYRVQAVNNPFAVRLGVCIGKLSVAARMMAFSGTRAPIDPTGQARSAW